MRIFALIAVFLFIIGVALFRIRGLEKEIDALKNAPADTSKTTKIDTLYCPSPEQIAQYESETERVAIEVKRLKKQLAQALNTSPDTTFIHDTTTEVIYMPREYKVYGDSTYRAVVSGVQPRLDSIEVYSKTITETITKTIQVPDKKRWGFGVNVSAGYDGKKVRPFVGVGVQYNVIRW